MTRKIRKIVKNVQLGTNPDSITAATCALIRKANDCKNDSNCHWGILSFFKQKIRKNCLLSE